MKNSFQLFLLDKNEKKGTDEDKELLIRQAALFYGVPADCLYGEKICRSRLGKPFFEKLDIHFSISHSESLWACLMGPFNCGLDVQYVKPCNFSKIAGRFFSEREKQYVERFGLTGFFDIWVRREAFGKYTGEGFFGDMPEFITEEGNLSEGFEKIRFETPNLDKDVKCAICIPKKATGAVRKKEKTADSGIYGKNAGKDEDMYVHTTVNIVRNWSRGENV